MSKMEFLKKAVLPVLTVWCLVILLRPLCMEQGRLDVRMLVLFMGIPFGIRQMFLVFVPGEIGIGGMAGVLVFNLLIGGLIGSLVMVWRLLVAAVTVVKGLCEGAFHLVL